MMNLQDARQKIGDWRDNNKDISCRVDETYMTSDGDLAFKGTSIRYDFSDFALGQALNRMGMPVRYIKKLFTERKDLVAEQYNHWASKDDRGALIRCTGEGTSNGRVRGFLSDSYTRLDDKDIFSAFEQFDFNSQGGNMINFFIDDRRLHIRVAFDNLTANVASTITQSGVDEVKVGFDLINSEVGASSLVISPMVYRLVCTNGLRMWTDDGDITRVRHAYKDEIDMYGTMAEGIGNAIRGGDDIVKGLIEARQAERHIENPLDVIAKLSKDNLYSKETAQKVQDSFMVEPESNWFGVINAFTRTAQNFDNERRLDMEKDAGKLLFTFDPALATYSLAE